MEYLDAIYALMMVPRRAFLSSTMKPSWMHDLVVGIGPVDVPVVEGPILVVTGV
jgi:hypothetical protein